MEEAQQAVQPAKSKLSKAERSQIMRDAANRRWDKAKKAKADAAAAKAKAAKAPAKALQVQKRPAAPREFSSALKMAEKRLAKAIQERAEAAAKYAVVSAEIPSLQQLIIALRAPLGLVPDYGGASLAPTLEQIVGDQPIYYQNPPLRREMPKQVPSQPPPIPMIPVPQNLHPANNPQNRAVGGALDVDLSDGEEPEDENQFLSDATTNIASGQWH